MERRFDAPRPTSFSFNADDQQRMVRFCQEVVSHIVMMQGRDALPIGVMAIGLANIANDLLASYPPKFRDKLVSEINKQIFAVAPAHDGPRLIRLH